MTSHHTTQQASSQPSTAESIQIETFQRLKTRQRQISESKIRIETNLVAAESELASLTQSIKETFQVTDIKQLRALHKSTFDHNNEILEAATKEADEAEAIIQAILDNMSTNK